MRHCVRCSKGPEGLEGHLELTLYPDESRYGAAAGHHLFICVKCSTRWERMYKGGGEFVWRKGEPAGD